MKIKKVKRYLVFLSFFILCCTPVLASNYSTANGVTLNGHKLDLDVKPIIIEGRTMVPVRAILERLGMNVTWDNNARVVIGKRQGDIIKISLEDDWLGEGTYNGVPFHSEHAPSIIVNGRTLVPVRTIANLLGLNVEWNQDNKMVILSQASKPQVSLKQSYEIVKTYPHSNDDGASPEYTYLPFGGYAAGNKYMLENYYIFAIHGRYEEINEDGDIDIGYTSSDSNLCVNKATGEIEVYEPEIEEDYNNNIVTVYCHAGHYVDRKDFIEDESRCKGCSIDRMLMSSSSFVDCSNCGAIGSIMRQDGICTDCNKKVIPAIVGLQNDGTITYDDGTKGTIETDRYLRFHI